MIHDVMTRLHQFFVLFLEVPAIFIVGGYLSYRLKWLQIRGLGKGFRLLFAKETTRVGNVSKRQTIAAVLGGNFGTGNISGMAVALSMGGPGAIIWMWAAVLFGLVIQYAHCVLGTLYRKETPRGYVGGPMYYLRDRLGRPLLASVFAIGVIIAALTVGGCVQVNAMSLPLAEFGIPRIFIGVIIASLLFVVMRQKTKGIVKICSLLVPVMAICYTLAMILILMNHHHAILPAVEMMWKGAWNISSVTGGTLGFGIMRIISTGMARSILATDIGTGMASMVQTEAQCNDPIAHGMIAMTAPILVLIVCTLTMLVLIVTGAYQTTYESTSMVMYAFIRGLGPVAGTLIVIQALFLFGYTTMLTWGACLEKAVLYLWGEGVIPYFCWIYVGVACLSALLPTYLAWGLGDLAVCSMVLINVGAIFLLRKEVVTIDPQQMLPISPV